MCQTPRYLHICPCSNPNCPRRSNDTLTARFLRPGKGHILGYEVQPQTWEYCDRWFFEQPYEVVLNAFIDPKDFCPYFAWKNMKQTDPICNECLQETAQIKAEKLAMLRARWDDSRVAVPYQLMPSYLKDADAQNTQAQGQNANLSQSGTHFAHTSTLGGSTSGSITGDGGRGTYATQDYGHHLPASAYPSAEPETREQLLERIKYLNERIGSLEALDERPNPPPNNRQRTLGVSNPRNPFDSVGKSGKPAITVSRSIRRITSYGAIGSERKAARSGNITGRSNAASVGSTDARSYGQPVGPAGRGQHATALTNEASRMSGTTIPSVNPFGVSRNLVPNPGAGNSYARPRHPYGAIGQEVGDLRRLVQNSEAGNSNAPTSNTFGAIGQRRQTSGHGGSGSEKRQEETSRKY